MARQINFEVQVMQGGRWSIHARYGATENEDAITDAKQVEGSGIGKVRVLRDIYDEATGMSNEKVIYASFGMGGTDKNDGIPGLSSSSEGSGFGGAGGGGKNRGGGSRSRNDDDEYDFRGSDFDDDSNSSSFDDSEYSSSNKKKSKKRSKKKPAKKDGVTTIPILISKLMLILLGSLGAALVSIELAAPYVSKINFFGTKLTGVSNDNAIIAIFIGTFIFSFLSMASLVLKNVRLKAARAKQRRAQPRAVAKPVQNTKPKQQTLDEEAQSLREEFAESDEMEKFREESAESRTESDDVDQKELEETEAEEEKKKPAPDPDDDPLKPLSPHAEKQKAYMMKFIKESMAGTGKDQASMNNFDKFGISLFLAGSSEALSDKRGIDKSDHAQIVSASVQTLGFKKVHAKGFASKHEEYLVQDATYMQMFQAGRNAMNMYLEDNSKVSSNMAEAMKNWNAPKKKEADAGPITVFFTDIAGSTAMTQKYGDAGAQQIVRAHNKIVREALSMFSGREIKHTGDGIMASFARTSDSIDASIQIQRETDVYTTATPDRPLHIKIGLNAGEPIAEDNDLFGTTVQMTARIVDKAKADQIYISEIVKGICAGKSYNFVNRGAFQMKGFETDPVLYEVMWRDE